MFFLPSPQKCWIFLSLTGFSFLPPLRCSRHVYSVTSIQGSWQDFLVAHRINYFDSPHKVRVRIFLSHTGFIFSVTLIRFMAGLSCHRHTRFDTGFSCRAPDFGFLPPLRCSRQFFPVTSIQVSRQDFLVAHRIFHFVPSIQGSWQDFLVAHQI